MQYYKAVLHFWHLGLDLSTEFFKSDLHAPHLFNGDMHAPVFSKGDPHAPTPPRATVYAPNMLQHLRR